jgi:hypothetical protein
MRFVAEVAQPLRRRLDVGGLPGQDQAVSGAAERVVDIAANLLTCGCRP